MHGGNGFLRAIVDGDISGVKADLKDKPDAANSQCLVGEKHSALHVAVIEGRPGMVRELLRCAPQIAVTDLVREL